MRKNNKEETLKKWGELLDKMGLNDVSTTKIDIARILDSDASRLINEDMNKEKYSIPIYENGIKTEWTIDGIIGDEKYQQLIEMTPEKKLPNMVNVNLNQNKNKDE